MANLTLAPPRPRPASRAPSGALRGRGRLIIIAAALAVAAIGVSQLVSFLRAPTPVVEANEFTLNGLTLHMTKVDWLAFDHEDTGGGFQMPASMMPDMPSHEQSRLIIEGYFADTTSDTAMALNLEDPEQFLLGASGERYMVHGDTFGNLNRLNPGQVVTGELYFDVPNPKPDDPPLYLDWKRGDDSVRLAITPGGSAPTHNHGG